VVVITGAGRGIGREHALAFARQGAKVVVNDLGAEPDGSGSSPGPAGEVVDAVRAMGGEAIANGDDISSWAGAEKLIGVTVDTFGRLDVLVTNAGILRDRTIANMSEEEWDAVVDVHLKGTFAPLHFAAAYWRDQSKAGVAVDGRVVMTSSTSGLFASAGQGNYGAAKAGIATLSMIAAKELGRYGVTVNCIAPAARTRLTGNLAPATDPDAFDLFDPANMSPLVVWLGSPEAAGVTGRVFVLLGGKITIADSWRRGPSVEQPRRWEPEELGAVIPGLVARAPEAESAVG
jgi:NAD(P)-dependent dehydrogenase (short-subunit alcohol dehydrogenase family)